MLNNIDSLHKALHTGLMPPADYELDEWADEFRFINEVSGEKWDTSRVEVARGPMRAITEPGVRTITVMCCTQLMKTELLLNCIGYFMHLDPCPILVVQPKEEVAKKFSSVRLKQMIKSTPVLKKLIAAETGLRGSHDTVGHKEFPGGHITIVSARTPSNLAMLPIRIVLLDEIDKYEGRVGDEGDPVDLAEERMATYSANSLSIRVCSPTIKGQSRIEASYLTSDQRKPFVECPHCEHWQMMLWKNVQWNKDEEERHLPDTALYHCGECGTGWSEAERLEALNTVHYRSQADFHCALCETVQKPSSWSVQDLHRWDNYGRAICPCGGRSPNSHAGFAAASKLYSPFRPLSEMVVKWVEAQGNIEKLKTFINTQLAEPFEELGERINNIDWLLARRERYQAELPNKVGIITAGADVHQDRVEIEIVGWGKEEESWSLDYLIIKGDPTTSQLWEDVDEALNKPYYREDGRLSYVAAACIDMQGGYTQQVASFCRTRMKRRIWPVRGMGGEGRPIPVWPKQPSMTQKSAVPFYNVGVDSAKNTIYARLLLNKEGDGYCHFPEERPEVWFKQLTAEKRVKRFKGTQSYYRWENPQRVRNEAFDCRVYAYAAFCGLQTLGWKVNIMVDEESLIMDAEFEEKRKQRLQGAKEIVRVKKADDPGSLSMASRTKKKKRAAARSKFMDK